MLSWSNATGVPVEAIRSMKEVSMDPEKEYVKSSYTDDYGNVTERWVNKNDPNDVLTFDLGPIGNRTTSGDTKPKTITSGALTVTPDEIKEGATLLNASKGSDGYVNTDVYNRMLERWMSNGGLAKDFFVYYPPKMYLNPEDPTRSGAVMTQYDEKDSGLENPF